MILSQKILVYITPIKLFIALLLLTTLMNVSLAQDATTASTLNATGTSNEAAYSPDDLFPTWDNGAYKVQGIAGENKGEKNKLFLQVVPRLIDLLIQFVAPIVFVMMVWAGLRFIYSHGNEEDREKAKNFFLYTVIGLLVIVMSYSIIKALYAVYVG